MNADRSAKREVSRKLRGALVNTALLLASCLVGLLLCEAGLRLFHPQYAPLAEAPFVRDPNLLFVREPNRCGFHRHPDTRALLPLCHNSLGLRQHREFSAADLESSVNLGFFGDSYVENINMEAQFSFTEPLDYLLNLGGEGGFNVLNFGVHGYGTGQSLLRYELGDLRQTLDHVIYVYSENDLMDDLKHGLFRFDDMGRLAREAAAPSRFALLSKLHLSYLVLNTAEWLGRRREQREAHDAAYEVPPNAFALFRQLLRRFKEAAESNGASFRIMWLPMESYDSPGIAAIVKEEGVATFSLWDCFGERDPDHLRTPWLTTTWPISPYQFKRNFHWNEAGNRLAAICLHRFLEGRLGLSRLSEEEVAQALDLYYSAFEGVAPATAAIRRKYGALAGDLAGRRAPWTPSPDKLAIRSRFDVYLHNGWLAYVKEGCAPADFDRRFFLHVWPVDVRDLPPERRAHGFDNLDFRPRIDEAACTVWRRLPSYAIERIATGQFSVDGNGGHQNLWEAEHVLSEG